MQGNKCFCSDVYFMSIVCIQDIDCNYLCFGYVFDVCGSFENFVYSVWNIGIDVYVEYEVGDDGEVNIDEEGVLWMLVVVKGVWNKGEDVLVMIMVYVCKFFDCVCVCGGEDFDFEELFKEV